MHKFLFFLFLSAASLAGTAQIKDPVKWTASSRKNGAIYEVVLTASMPAPWHIYSQTTGEGGPIPTKITFTKNPLLSLQGAIKETGKLQQEYDKNFNTQVKYFGNKVDFIQTLKVKGNVKTNVGVTVEYMTCDDKQCLPPVKKTFNVTLK